jgi:hypothetical protein
MKTVSVAQFPDTPPSPPPSFVEKPPTGEEDCNKQKILNIVYIMVSS